MKHFLCLLVVLSIAAVLSIKGKAECREPQESAYYPLVIAISDPAGKQEKAAGQAVAYDPQIEYRGVFEKNRVYRKRFSNDIWKSTLRPEKIFSVTCSQAAKALGTDGFWTGNLNTNGSCGPTAEPAEWAIGNYLNYQAAQDSE